MAYQNVREPLRAAEADRLAAACKTVEEKLIVWALLDTGLRVVDLCSLKPESIHWHQRQIRVKGKGGPFGKTSKIRVVPISSRVRALFDPYFAVHEDFPVGPRQVQKTVKGIANRAKLAQEVTPHVLHYTFTTLALQKGLSLAAVKKLLGHDRLSTTDIYLNLTDGHVLEEYEQKW
jgi:integrase/recombinase XerD